MAVTANARYSDFFPLEIFHLLDLWPGHNRVGKDIFHRADKNKISGSLHKGTDKCRPPANRNLGVLAEHHCSCQWRGADVDELEIKIILLKEPGCLSDPGHAFRDRLSGMDANELVDR